MQIKLGSIVTDLSGRLGGQVGYHDGSGSHLGSLAMQRATPTARQLAIRSRSQILAQRWRSLTQSQRDRWNRVTYFNQSGFSLFKMQNGRRILGGLTISTVPVAPVPPPATPLFTVAADQSTVIMRVTPQSAVPASVRFFIECTGVVSPGTRIGSGTFKFLRFSESSAAVFISINTQYIARFGRFRSGRSIDVLMYCMHRASGARSQPRIVRKVITA